jgi:hypothetical protein
LKKPASLRNEAGFLAKIQKTVGLGRHLYGFKFLIHPS